MFATLNNCAFVTTKTDSKHENPFTFLMDSLMLGIGVGFDTRGANHIPVSQPSNDSVDNFTIPDTREGWV